MNKITYKDAGVNIEKGYETVKKIKKSVEKTFDKNVLTGLGSFAGLYKLDKIENPVLVTGTDGVGTKLLLAQMMNRHSTVGQDLVAMCVNDILCHGAKPLLFLDYVASGKVEPDKMAGIVEGIAKACQMAHLSLVGGETAEMPGMYGNGEYDLAGFVVGIIDQNKIINGENIKPGDKIIGLASSGPHSNGYSFLRKVFFDVNKYKTDDYIDEFKDTIGNVLLTPTTIYTDVIMKLMGNITLKGIANITGGGFIENIPRTLPDGVSAKIYKDSWEIQPIFKLTQKLSNLSDEEMFNTLNMGIGMVLVVDESDVKDVIKIADELGQKANMIGEIVLGDEGVIL
ncbi:MAG: phosphoribosylformylglycinamidine cyclo-ligase [Clostridiales bacterium]|nr:phosphoribosylformylglycinamidine cyclo-ligase [Clostridiales bacterium]